MPLNSVSAAFSEFMRDFDDVKNGEILHSSKGILNNSTIKIRMYK